MSSVRSYEPLARDTGRAPFSPPPNAGYRKTTYDSDHQPETNYRNNYTSPNTEKTQNGQPYQKLKHIYNKRRDQFSQHQSQYFDSSRASVAYTVSGSVLQPKYKSLTDLHEKVPNQNGYPEFEKSGSSESRERNYEPGVQRWASNQSIPENFPQNLERKFSNNQGSELDAVLLTTSGQQKLCPVHKKIVSRHKSMDSLQFQGENRPHIKSPSNAYESFQGHQNGFHPKYHHRSYDNLNSAERNHDQGFENDKFPYRYQNNEPNSRSSTLPAHYSDWQPNQKYNYDVMKQTERNSFQRDSLTSENYDSPVGRKYSYDPKFNYNSREGTPSKDNFMPISGIYSMSASDLNNVHRANESHYHRPSHEIRWAEPRPKYSAPEPTDQTSNSVFTNGRPNDKYTDLVTNPRSRYDKYTSSRQPEKLPSDNEPIYREDVAPKQPTEQNVARGSPDVDTSRKPLRESIESGYSTQESVMNQGIHQFNPPHSGLLSFLCSESLLTISVIFNLKC